MISGTYDVLTNISVFNAFAFYTLLAFGLIKAKRKKILTGKIPGYPAAPILFILLTLVFLLNTLITNPQQSATGIGLTMIGIPFYYFFRNRNSKTKPLELK